MIQHYGLLIAAEGKTLYYPKEDIVWGTMARLGMYKGEMLKEEDFIEVNKSDVIKIDDSDYVFYNWKYSDIVEFIIKLHYNYNAQITLMMEKDEKPEEYREMQEWRDYAKEIARRIAVDVEK